MKQETNRVHNLLPIVIITYDPEEHHVVQTFRNLFGGKYDPQSNSRTTLVIEMIHRWKC